MEDEIESCRSKRKEGGGGGVLLLLSPGQLEEGETRRLGGEKEEEVEPTFEGADDFRICSETRNKNREIARGDSSRLA